jgi:hypothetical protein
MSDESHIADEVATLARRYRKESIATLIAAIRDERARPTARITAAVKLLEYASGKPGPARQVTIADVNAMTRDECVDLLHACCERLERVEPGLLWEIMGKTVERAGVPRSSRFTRGSASPLPRHVPPPRPSRNAAIEPLSASADGAPKPPSAPPHRQPPPPTPEPSPLPPAAKGNGALNGHAFDPANFSNADYDAAGRPLRKIGYGDPAPGWASR